MRSLLCAGCGQNYRYPDDCRARIVKGPAKVPTREQRTITVEEFKGDEVLSSKTSEMEPGHYNCDFCNKEIAPGEEAVCVTAWRDLAGEPALWESDFIEGPGL